MQLQNNEKVERRIYGTELRVAPGPNPVIEGYAAVFDKLSEPMMGMREIIRPGAFTRTLKEDADVRALVDHDPSKILGRVKSGTLTLTEDKMGLRVKINPPDTQAGRDIVESIRRGDVDQMSFAFVTREDKWESDEEGNAVTRELLDVDLFDVSPVTFPAYPDTTVAVRSMGAFADERLRRLAAVAKAHVDKMKRTG